MDGGLTPPRTEYLEPEFERMDISSLKALQFGSFQEELARVWGGNAFFRDHYERAGFRPDVVRSIDDLYRVPVVTKADILADAEARPPYGTRLQVPEGEIVQVVESSGTSGRRPAVQALAAGDLERIVRAKLFQWHWIGGRKGTVVGLQIPVTMAAGGLWSLAALQRLGSNVLRLGSLPAEVRIEQMHRYSVEVTQTSASYLMRLEHAASEAGLDLRRDFRRLRSISVGSGGWTVKWAEDHSQRWNARLFEGYACSERAFAFTCEWGLLHDSRPGVMHFLPHLGLVEVIDRETGRHVAPGDEGEIVITPFGMTAAPLIRYATGDRARFRAAESCPCGRAFDGIEAGSVGRYDDVLRIKGVNLALKSIDEVVFSHSFVTDYCGELYVERDGREVAKVMVELDPSARSALRDRLLLDLAEDLHRRLHLRFSVEEWAGSRSTADSSGTMKARRWADRRTATRELERREA